MGLCSSRSASVGILTESHVISVIGPAECGKTQFVDIVLTNGIDDPANEGVRRSKKRGYRSTQQDAKKNVPFNSKEHGKQTIDLYEFGGYMESLWVLNLFRVHGIVIVLDASSEESAKKGLSDQKMKDVIKDENFKEKPFLVLGNVKSTPGNGELKSEDLRKLWASEYGESEYLVDAFCANLYPENPTLRMPEIVTEFEKLVDRICQENVEKGLRDRVSRLILENEEKRKKEAEARKARVAKQKEEREKNKAAGKSNSKVAPLPTSENVEEKKTVKEKKKFYCQRCKDTKENEEDWNEAIKKSALYRHRGNWAPLCQHCIDEIEKENERKAEEFKKDAIPVGTKVEATIEEWKQWYKGEIEAIDGVNGAYLVHFEDGEKKPVFPGNIKVIS